MPDKSFETAATTLTPRLLSRTSRDLLDLLAFIYLEHGRPERSVALLEALVAEDNVDLRLCGALALAQLRNGTADRALATLERMPLRYRLEPACQLLRAQVLSALQRHDEAAAAMRAFVEGRKASEAGAATAHS